MSRRAKKNVLQSLALIFLATGFFQAGCSEDEESPPIGTPNDSGSLSDTQSSGMDQGLPGDTGGTGPTMDMGTRDTGGPGVDMAGPPAEDMSIDGAREDFDMGSMKDTENPEDMANPTDMNGEDLGEEDVNGEEEMGTPDTGGPSMCPQPQSDTIVDVRDCQEYAIVTISSQTWLAENLNYEPPGRTSWCYNDFQGNCDTFGRLYDWATALGLPDSANAQSVGNQNGVQGVCPAGWHIPTQREWQDLIDEAGGGQNAGNRLKSNNGEWQQGNSADSYGFSALPGGSRSRFGRFSLLGFVGNYITATQTSAREMAFLYLSGASDRARLDDDSNDSGNRKGIGRSVRCIQD